MRRILLNALLMIICFAAPMIASAQTVQLGGVIKDAETGESVIGASVMVKGTTTGTITDLEGIFSLRASSGGEILVSAMGYEDYSFVAGTGMTSLNILLRPSSQFLDEVVFVGYGTQKKVNLTGAVSTVNFEDMAEIR